MKLIAATTKFSNRQIKLFSINSKENMQNKEKEKFMSKKISCKAMVDSYLDL